MKKISALFIALCLLFCSCGAVPPGETVKNALLLPATISVTCGNSAFSAYVHSEGFEVEYTAPRALEGVELRGGPAGVFVAADGYSREVGEKVFPAAEGFVKAVRAISDAEKPDEESAGFCRYAIDEMQIMVYYDLDSGLITNILTEDETARTEYGVVSIVNDERTGHGDGRS